MSHRKKLDIEIEILKKCVIECKKLPKKSPEKRRIWEKYANILNNDERINNNDERIFIKYTPKEVGMFYNNHRDDGRMNPEAPEASQTPQTPKIPQNPAPFLPTEQQSQTATQGQLFSPIQQPPSQAIQPIFSEQPPTQQGQISQPPDPPQRTFSDIFSSKSSQTSTLQFSPTSSQTPNLQFSSTSSQTPNLQFSSTSSQTPNLQFSPTSSQTPNLQFSSTSSLGSIPLFSPIESLPQSPQKPSEDSIPQQSEKNENKSENEEEEVQTKQKSSKNNRGCNSTSSNCYQPHLIHIDNLDHKPLIYNDSSYSYSSSSSAPVVQNDVQLTDKLLEVPQINGVLSQESYDQIKFDLYSRIDNYQSTIGKAYKYYKEKITPFDQSKLNEMLLNFQKLIEEKFIHVLNIFHEKLSVSLIYSRDKNIERIIPPKSSRTISKTTRYYNTDDEFFSYSSSSSSESNPVVVMQSSADIYKKEEDNNNEFNIEAYYKKYMIERFSKNPKIINMYSGKFDKNTAKSIVIENIESATIVSYKKKDCENGFVCDFAYVKFDKNSYILHFRDLEVETGFFLPAQTMHFHRDEEENTNKIYICADLRIKEFQINGLDSNEKEIEIKNTNTFYFGEKCCISAVITVWDDELVFGCDSSIFFWSLKNYKNSNKVQTRLKNKDNTKKAKNSGIDLDKVDWKEGKLYEDKINIKEMEKITSLTVINSSESENLLAVASDIYPVIYIYNKKRQNVFRLISHTMGVTSLKSFNNNLISGSLDLKAKIWDINECRVTKLFYSLDQNIAALDADTYCDNIILFTGGEVHSKSGKPYNSSVIASSITDKKAMFEIQLKDDFIPNEIAFIPGKNQNGEFARLVFISYKANSDAQKTCKIRFLDFN